MRPVPTAELVDSKAEIYDCWNRIGVRGDRSCTELDIHSHCRNCPAYSAAATMLLDRELTVMTSPITEVTPANEGDMQSVVIFRVGSEWFALLTLLLDEIVGMRTIHALPHR